MLLNSLLFFALWTNVLSHDMSAATDDNNGLLIDFDDGHVGGSSNVKDEENIIIFEDLTDSPTRVPTISSKTRKPTNKPSAPIPTQKPTRKILLLFYSLLRRPHPSLIAGIYLDNKDIVISETGQQILTGCLTIVLFIGMAFEFLSPEVLFMNALIILMLCQILSLSETLSGLSLSCISLSLSLDLSLSLSVTPCLSLSLPRFSLRFRK
jgi:hypothetical protein